MHLREWQPWEFKRQCGFTIAEFDVLKDNAVMQRMFLASRDPFGKCDTFDAVLAKSCKPELRKMPYEEELFMVLCWARNPPTGGYHRMETIWRYSHASIEYSCKLVSALHECP